MTATLGRAVTVTDVARAVTGEGRTILPLTADRTLGAIILVWDRAKDFSGSERLSLSTVAARCAPALARVQLFEAQAGAAHNLQQALLAGELPKLDGVERAARYYTAGSSPCTPLSSSPDRRWACWNTTATGSTPSCSRPAARSPCSPTGSRS